MSDFTVPSVESHFYHQDCDLYLFLPKSLPPVPEDGDTFLTELVRHDRSSGIAFDYTQSSSLEELPECEAPFTTMIHATEGMRYLFREPKTRLPADEERWRIRVERRSTVRHTTLRTQSSRQSLSEPRIETTAPSRSLSRIQMPPPSALPKSKSQTGMQTSSSTEPPQPQTSLSRFTRAASTSALPESLTANPWASEGSAAWKLREKSASPATTERGVSPAPSTASGSKPEASPTTTAALQADDLSIAERIAQPTHPSLTLTDVGEGSDVAVQEDLEHASETGKSDASMKEAASAKGGAAAAEGEAAAAEEKGAVPQEEGEKEADVVAMEKDPSPKAATADEETIRADPTAAQQELQKDAAAEVQQSHRAATAEEEEEEAEEQQTDVTVKQPEEDAAMKGSPTEVESMQALESATKAVDADVPAASPTTAADGTAAEESEPQVAGSGLGEHATSQEQSSEEIPSASVLLAQEVVADERPETPSPTTEDQEEERKRKGKGKERDERDISQPAQPPTPLEETPLPTPRPAHRLVTSTPPLPPTTMRPPVSAASAASATSAGAAKAKAAALASARSSAAPLPPRNIFRRPWEEPELGTADIPAPTEAMRLRDDAGTLRSLRSAMLQSTSKAALESASQDFGAAHMTAFPSPQALAELSARKASLGGRMYLDHLTAAVHCVKMYIIYEATLDRKFAVDLKLLCQALPARQLANFLADQVLSWANAFLRDMDDADDLKAARFELRPEMHATSGTYQVLTGCVNPLGAHLPLSEFEYTGESNNLLRRFGEHDKAFVAKEKAEGSGKEGNVKALPKGMKLLHQTRVVRRAHFVWTCGPPECTTAASMVAWLERTFARYAGHKDLTLRQLGAARCKTKADQDEYILRQVRAFAEHCMTAMRNTVSVLGYDDVSTVLAGARFASKFQGANRYTPKVGFGSLQGSLASRLPKAQKEPSAAQKSKAFGSVFRRLDEPSITPSLLGSQPPPRDPRPLALMALTASQDPAVGAAGPSRPLTMTALAQFSAAQEADAAAATGVPRAGERSRPIEMFLDSDDSDSDDSDSDSGSDGDSDLFVPSQQFVSLNVKYKGKLDKIKYVDKLPPDASGSQEAEEAAWRVDVKKRTVFCLAAIGKDERQITWDAMTTSKFLGMVKGDSFFVKVAASLPAFEVKLPSPMPPGKTLLVLKKIVVDNFAVQARSSSAEVAFLLKHWSVELRSQVENPPPPVYYRPFAEDVSPQWTELLQPLAVVASMKMDEDIVYSEGQGLLSRAGVRLRQGWCRCALKPAKRKGWSIVDLPGDPWEWAEYGHFGDVDENGVVEIREPDTDSWGRPQDVLFQVNETKIADYSVVYYSLLPRLSTDPPVGRGKKLIEYYVDEWVICFLRNLPRISRGCKKADLVRPKVLGLPPPPSPSEAAEADSSKRSAAADDEPAIAQKKVKAKR